MNRKQILVLTASAASLLAGAAFASNIYQHTDAEGNAHYADRPSGADAEKRIAVAAKRSSRNASTSGRSRTAATTATPPAEPAEERKQTRSEKIAEKKAREERCATYRAKLETMASSQRLYRERDDGEREYLDDAEIDAARARAQELIEENCS